MNHHKFLMIRMLKYHPQIWCLIIYKPFYQATVFCNTRHYLKKFGHQLIENQHLVIFQHTNLEKFMVIHNLQT